MRWPTPTPAAEPNPRHARELRVLSWGQSWGWRLRRGLRGTNPGEGNATFRCLSRL